LIRREIALEPRPRGIHPITSEVEASLPELAEYRIGLVHLMIRHTSASLAVTENASPDVPRDIGAWLDDVVSEDFRWTHTAEGPDDMPAHVKSVITSTELTVPVTEGRLDLGTWQGLFLCEHRNSGGSRRITVTIWGEGTGGSDRSRDH
jgi:secondary thiamine-phosphate synthase enzyme